MTLSKTLYSLLLDQPRKHPNMTEKLLTGTNDNAPIKANKQNILKIITQYISNNTFFVKQEGQSLKSTCMGKVFRIIPEFRILRLIFYYNLPNSAF